MPKDTIEQEQKKLRRKELAVKLAEVLNHPDLPADLEEGIGEGLTDLFNNLGKGLWKKIEYNPDYIALLLDADAEASKR